MSYIHKVTGQYPITEREIRAANPNTSFPEPFVAPDQYDWVFPSPQPAHDPITQRVAEIAPELTAIGKYEQRWQVLQLPAEQSTANLAAARDQKWDAIKAERDRRKYLGVKVGAHWFHSDDPSRIQQLALAMMGNAIPAGLMWKTLTTTPPPVFVEMTPALAQGIFQATAASDAAIFAAAETHRNAMEASADPSAYDFSTGWPASIEDTP